MDIQDACKYVDDIRTGFYVDNALRRLAVEAFQQEALAARGRWVNGETNYGTFLRVEQVCDDAIAVLRRPH